MKRVLATSAVFVLVLAAAAAAHAASIVNGSKSNSQEKLGFGPAFVPCLAPNATTEGGLLPACVPAETFNEGAGSPADGWLFTPDTKVELKMKSGANKVVDPLNPPDSWDTTLQLKLKGINDATGPATSEGTLMLFVRLTLDDRVGGPMTTVDFPLTTAVSVAAGKGKLKTSVNALLNQQTAPGLPDTFAMQVVTAQLRDPNNNPFGVSGVVASPPCPPRCFDEE